MDWIVTIPKTISWDDYQKELDAVEDGKFRMNYKTRYFPKEMKVGDKCYLLWNGNVRGWMRIVGLKEYPHDWKCATTGVVWPAGKYIQRSGPLYDTEPIQMTGFRGIRKYK